MKTHGWKLDPAKRAYYDAIEEKRMAAKRARIEAEWRGALLNKWPAVDLTASEITRAHAKFIAQLYE